MTHITYYIVEVVMSISGFFILVLYVLTLTGMYVLREEMFQTRDPILFIMIPFFILLFMMTYALTVSVK